MAGGERERERDERNAAASLGASLLSTTDWLPMYTAASPLQISGFQRGQEGVTQSAAGPKRTGPGQKLARFPGPIRHGRRLEKLGGHRGRY